MARRYLFPLLFCLAAACMTAPPPASAGTHKAGKRTPSLPAFPDEQAFERQLAQWRAQAETARGQRVQRRFASAAIAAPAAPAMTADAAAESAAAETITNVQTAGVDEGGIVKRHGDHLVVLRRGRLFTVRVGDDQLRPVATVDAFAPGVDPAGTWYDEMLIGRDTVVVVGYSYARGGTELVLFDIDRAGALRYRDTWHLRSNDYYSARNSASRLAGDTLVFYTPMRLDMHAATGDRLPALRRWRTDALPEAFRRILPATRIYRGDDGLDPATTGIALHTVTRCDLSRREFDCSASAVLGPPGRVFYVSADSVYVWTTGGAGDGGRNTSSVFRIPLDGSAPTGLRTRGVPVDQLSFLQDAHGHLNVLLTAQGQGEGMWGDRSNAGAMALLRVPLSRFGDGSRAAPDRAYRPLPGAADGAMQNRFVGDWLLYGSAPHRWRHAEAGIDRSSGTHALRYAGNDAPQLLRTPHGVERIEVLGRHALLVGGAGADLHFTSVRLGGRAQVASRHVQRDAAQGESRTHGFFHRGDGPDRGILGLPVIAQHGHDHPPRTGASASVLYLRNSGLQLSPIGELAATAGHTVDDGCKASCVDWYGNARPLFLGERVFALLGYELVEGHVDAGRIVERRRVDFTPATAIAGHDLAAP